MSEPREKNEVDFLMEKLGEALEGLRRRGHTAPALHGRRECPHCRAAIRIDELRHDIERGRP